MGDLGKGMDACVGAARSGKADRVAQNGLERFLHKRLDRLAIGLDLPARIVCSVVRESEFVAVE